MQDDEEDNKKISTQDGVVRLHDAQLDETETDEPLRRHVSFQLPNSRSSSPQPTVLDLQEPQSLISELIDSILPDGERNVAESALSNKPISITIGESEPILTAVTRPFEDERLQRILQLLDRYTQNLEEHMFTSNRTGQQPEKVIYSEQETQTLPLDIPRLHHPHTTQPKSNRGIAWDELHQPRRHMEQLQLHFQQQQQQQQSPLEPPAPCECRQHVINIRSNGSAAIGRTPDEPRTFLRTVGSTLGDFAATCCLCFQVNKDCIFCLGFFIAFVISASFLTAFFYRTINLATTAVRVPVDPSHFAQATQANEVATLRLNGGYYYVYNTHRQHFV